MEKLERGKLILICPTLNISHREVDGKNDDHADHSDDKDEHDHVSLEPANNIDHTGRDGGSNSDLTY